MSAPLIIQLLQNLVFDSLVLLKADSQETLIKCWEALRSLLFPFVKLDVYRPCLAHELLDQVTSPFNYSMGYLRKYESDVELKLLQIKQGCVNNGIFIVDIDQNKLVFTNQPPLPSFPLLEKELTKKYLPKLTDSLQKAVEVRRACFYFFCCLVK